MKFGKTLAVLATTALLTLSCAKKPKSEDKPLAYYNPRASMSTIAWIEAGVRYKEPRYFKNALKTNLVPEDSSILRHIADSVLYAESQEEWNQNYAYQYFELLKEAISFAPDTLTKENYIAEGVRHANWCLSSQKTSDNYDAISFYEFVVDQPIWRGYKENLTKFLRDYYEEKSLKLPMGDPAKAEASEKAEKFGRLFNQFSISF